MSTSDYDLLLPVESPHPGRRVAFGSNVERLMFPLHSAPTRLGIEQGLRGESHRGPGCYEKDVMMLFLQPLDQCPHSHNGWYFGATSGPRLHQQRDHKLPGPADYYSTREELVKRRTSSERDKSPPLERFGAKCPRFSKHQYHTPNPGPGSYSHDVATNRHVEYCESFGGTRALKHEVIVKCTRGIAEKCSKCDCNQVGDYYQRRGGGADYNVCPACMAAIRSSSTEHISSMMGSGSYYKVRDCSYIHYHEYPGADPKLLLKTESDQRKLRLKESYLRLYY